jgi:hypothetical protein
MIALQVKSVTDMMMKNGKRFLRGNTGDDEYPSCTILVDDHTRLLQA